MSSEIQSNRTHSGMKHKQPHVSLYPGGLDKDVTSEIYNKRTQNHFLQVCFSVFIYVLLCTVIDTFPCISQGTSESIDWQHQTQALHPAIEWHRNLLQCNRCKGQHVGNIALYSSTAHTQKHTPTQEGKRTSPTPKLDLSQVTKELTSQVTHRGHTSNSQRPGWVNHCPRAKSPASHQL